MNKSRMRKRISYFILRVIMGATALLFVVWIYIAQPSFRSNSPSQVEVNKVALKEHVLTLSEQFHPRNHFWLKNLNATSKYIEHHLQNAGGKTRFQDFKVGRKNFRNVIATFGSSQKEKLIIGAHYDSCYDTPGADDNASGVAGLLELGRLLGETKLNREIELVAFSLEEPPHYGTSAMGSYAHASEIASGSESITGVIILEMIGYFSSETASQKFPIPLLYLMYPNRGNFIAVVGNMNQRKFTKAVKTGMKNTSDLPVYSLNAPEKLPGIDFSDHRNYWPHGINAVMITDTAFYRNDQYHKLGDTEDRLNYFSMAKVVAAVYETAIKIDAGTE